MNLGLLKCSRKTCALRLLQGFHISAKDYARGKPVGVAKTLQQRLAGEFFNDKIFLNFYDFFLVEENFEDPVLHQKNDIGFPLAKAPRSAEIKQRIEHIKAQRKDVNLEKLARSNKCN